jgi:hypothetical protein
MILASFKTVFRGYPWRIECPSNENLLPKDLLSILKIRFLEVLGLAKVFFLKGWGVIYREMGWEIDSL